MWLESPNGDQIQKLVAWGANSVSSDLEESTVYLVSNSDPQPRALWHAVLKGGVVMSEGLLEVQFAVFSIRFCKPAVNKKKKIFFPQSCAPREARCANSYRIIATNSWENSDSTSAHMVLCLESEKKTFQKKGELSKLTKNSWTC